MKRIFILALAALCVGNVAQAQLSSRSRIGDLLGIPIRPYGGVQLGVLSFYGDVTPRTGHNWLTGMPGAKLDLMLEIGTEGMFAGKLSFMYGMFKESQAYRIGEVQVPADQSLYSPATMPQYYDLSSYEEGNLNFRTHFFNIGIQGEYRIKNIPGMRNIYPYVTTGINLLIFNPHADRFYTSSTGPALYEKERLKGYGHPTPAYDHNYETELKSANLYGQGSFSTISVGFPLEVGFDFRVLPTVNIRLGTSFTFTLTDNIDGVSGSMARSSAFDVTQPYDAAVNRASRLQVNSIYDFYAYSYVACYFYLPFL